MRRGCASRDFWRKFYEDFPALTIDAKVVTTSMQHAKQCTREVAGASLERLRTTLRSLGIYERDSDKFVPGKEGNLIWLDEFNQFYNYNLSRGNNLLRTTRTGQRARSAAFENRGTFTGSVACGFDMYDPQMIFSAAEFSLHMTCESARELEYMLISITEGGCQTGETFLAWLKSIQAQARSRGLTGPLCFAMDAHSSRFWIETLRWLRLNDHDMFITAPNATGSCCMLDQIFQDAHRVYDDNVMDLKHEYGPDVVIGVNEAVRIFVQMWLKPWCSYEQRRRGYRVVGLAEGRISINFMPDDQFRIGEAIAAAAAAGQQLALEAAPAEAAEPEEPTPDQAIKRGTKEYLEAKVVLMRGAVDAERKRK